QPLPAGTQSAVLTALHASHTPAQSFPYAAHAASIEYRNAALLELADRLLGELTDAIVLALGVETTARRVLISAAQHRHAIARRQVSTQIDADLVASRLTEALTNLRFLLTPQRNPRVFEVVGFSPLAGKCICMPLKLVRAASAATKQDEWWVKTAIPFGASTYRRRRARNELLALQAGELPKNFSPT